MFNWLKPRKPALVAQPARAAPAASINARALLARVAWTSARRLDGLLQGDYRTLSRGAGLMLADLREYEARDDVRHIDWNVTARMQTPYVRQYEQDRELATWFVVDLSASVDFGSQGQTKREVAAQAIATIGHLLQRHGNRVGAIIDLGRANLDIIPARSGRRHLLHVLQEVLTAPTQATNQVTNLSQLFVRATRLIKQRSTVFILSDFYADHGWDKALMMLASRHDVVAVRLVDPLEQNLPDMGMLTMRDAETGEQVFIDTSDSRFRERFSQRAFEHETRLAQTLSRSGVDCLELATGESVHEGLIQFIRQRQALMRQSGGGTRRA